MICFGGLFDWYYVAFRGLLWAIFITLLGLFGLVFRIMLYIMYFLWYFDLGAKLLISLLNLKVRKEKEDSRSKI